MPDEAPTDVTQLCAELGIGLKRRARLASEHGDDFVPYLQGLWLWAKQQDPPHLLHRHATASTYDYVQTTYLAMQGQEGGEPEAVQGDEIEHYRDSRQAKARHKLEQHERAGELLGAIRYLKGAVYEMDPELKRKISRELWQLKGRIDVLERKLKRDA